MNDCFEILNGLGKFVLLRLCHLVELQSEIEIKIKDAKIRAMMGMSQEHLACKTNLLFISNRKASMKVPMTLRLNPSARYSHTHTPTGERYIFAYSSSISLDYLIAEGAFRWTIKFEFGTDKDSSFLRIGVAPPRFLNELAIRSLGVLDGSSCCFRFGRDNCTYLDGVYDGGAIPNRETTVPDCSLVAADINTVTRTLSFFVNGKRVPRAISEVPVPLHFGVSGGGGSSFVCVSFLRVAARPSSSATASLVTEAQAHAFHRFKTPEMSGQTRVVWKKR